MDEGRWGTAVKISIVPIGKDNVIVSTGRSKVIHAGRIILVLVVLCLLRVDSIVSKRLLGFHEYLRNLRSISLSPSNDRWAWLLGSSGEFSVHSARTFIDDILLPFVGDVTRWVKVVPIK
ncbi:hypothetical protein Tco_1260979, partial [Tanacetum coccineum]